MRQTHTPQNNGGVVSLFHDHLVRHFQKRFLCHCVLDLTDARNLGEDQKPQFIAAIQKMMRLRIMRRPNSITPQFLLQDAGILPLQASRHSIPHIGIGLAAAESADRKPSAVQIESAHLPANMAKTDAIGMDIHGLAIQPQLSPHFITNRRSRIPEMDVSRQRSGLSAFGQGLVGDLLSVQKLADHKPSLGEAFASGLRKRDMREDVSGHLHAL